MKELIKKSLEEFDEKFKGWILQDDQEYHRSFEVIKVFLESSQLSLIEHLKKEVAGMKKQICNNGGYGHEHNPWDCGTKLCEYCQHIQDKKCDNLDGYSTQEIITYNTSLDDVLTLLESIK